MGSISEKHSPDHSIKLYSQDQSNPSIEAAWPWYWIQTRDIIKLPGILGTATYRNVFLIGFLDHEQPDCTPDPFAGYFQQQYPSLNRIKATQYETLGASLLRLFVPSALRCSGIDDFALALIIHPEQLANFGIQLGFQYQAFLPPGRFMTNEAYARIMLRRLAAVAEEYNVYAANFVIRQIVTRDVVTAIKIQFSEYREKRFKHLTRTIYLEGKRRVMDLTNVIGVGAGTAAALEKYQNQLQDELKGV
ncbi:hypothetical protein ABW19_dt0204368 [Dactylella cylindrospora]|nr:hypothetical protein ABW19_dt0204368 [Dactylella cylindrospora]